MHKSNRLFHRTISVRNRKWLCLLAALTIIATSLCLPLWAMSPRRNDRGIMGDIRDGIRDFGRDVSDMVDPDNDGILPDGSIDNGIADDGNQNTPSTPGTPGSTDDSILPGATDTPSDGTNAPDVTDRVPDTSADTNQTDKPDVTTDRPNGAPDGDVSGNAPDGDTTNDGDTTDTTDKGGFPWGGIIIALVIVAAVVLLIVMLLPKRKDREM